MFVLYYPLNFLFLHNNHGLARGQPLLGENSQYYFRQETDCLASPGNRAYIRSQVQTFN